MDEFHKQAWSIKILYLILFIAIGFSVPFSGVFYKHVLTRPDGTPAIELLGIIYFIMPIIGLIANLTSGVIADRLRVGKHIITWCCVGDIFLSLLMAQAGESWTAAWPLKVKFAYIFSLLLVLTFFESPINPLVDSETLFFLNRYGKREWYGRLRLWGTYGWSIATIIMGVMLYFVNNYKIIYYGTAAGYLVVVLITFSGLSSGPRREKIVLPWSHLKNDSMFLRFLLFVFTSGIILNACFCYMGYFFDDVMKTPLEIGLIFGTWTMLEIPVMMFSDKLLAFMGNRWLIIIGFLLNALRLWLFSYFTYETPFFYKFAAALLQGPAFGMTHIGIIDFVDRQAHPTMRATYMSVTNIARMSIATSIGGLLGGWIIKYWGGAFLMRLGGGVVTVLLLYFVFFVKGHGPLQKQPLAKSE